MNRYLIPILLSLLSVLVYVFYVDRIYVEAQQQLAKEVELMGFLADASVAREKLDQVIAEYEKFPQGADHALEVLLPEKFDSVRLIVDVNAVLDRHGLVMKGPRVTSDAPQFDPNIDPLMVEEQKYQKYKLSFSTMATYNVLRDFLKDLEVSLALRDFASVSFSAGEVKQDDPLMAADPGLALSEYSIEIISYALPTP